MLTVYFEQSCLSPYMEYCWRHYDNATVTSTVSIYGDILLSPYIEICPNYMEYCWRHYDNATVTSTVSIYGDVVLSPLSIYRDVPIYADVVGLLIYRAGLSPYMEIWGRFHIWRFAHIWRCGWPAYILSRAQYMSVCMSVLYVSIQYMEMCPYVEMWCCLHIWRCAHIWWTADIRQVHNVSSCPRVDCMLDLFIDLFIYYTHHTNMRKYMHFIREVDNVRLPRKSKTMHVLLVV